MMIPIDPTLPSEFVGVDFTAYFRGPAVYDGEAVSGRVMDVVEAYLTESRISCRRCFYPGRGAAAGGPAFLEVLLWVQEHWEFLAGAASVVLARVAKVRDKWRQLRRMWEERILDPYKPSVFIDLAVRTQANGNEGLQEAALSFRALLSRVPDISERLRREVPEHKFTFRVLTVGSQSYTWSASFRVSEVKRSDAAKMVRYMEQDGVPDGHSEVTLYRKFGFLTRVEPNEGNNLTTSIMR